MVITARTVGFIRSASDCSDQPSMPASTCRTVQEREQDYSKARARIFGVQQNSDPGMSPSHSPQMHDNAMRGMMNGNRPPNVGPLGGRGRGPPGRVDQGKKAVFRNREQDLQDPDYRRSVYRCSFTQRLCKRPTLDLYVTLSISLLSAPSLSRL